MPHKNPFRGHMKGIIIPVRTYKQHNNLYIWVSFSTKVATKSHSIISNPQRKILSRTLVVEDIAAGIFLTANLQTLLNLWKITNMYKDVLVSNGTTKNS